MTHIIIVTGEGEWKDRYTIYRVLDEELMEFLDPGGISNLSLDSYTTQARKSFTLRHGACPNGADAIANEWGTNRGVTIELFPAQWMGPNGYNPAAGPLRNREMAEALPRATKCVAFWSGRLRKVGNRDVSGTLDMMKQALQHHIPLRVEPPEPIHTP